jgi:hypothetical protein
MGALSLCYVEFGVHSFSLKSRVGFSLIITCCFFVGGLFARLSFVYFYLIPFHFSTPLDASVHVHYSVGPFPFYWDFTAYCFSSTDSLFFCWVHSYIFFSCCHFVPISNFLSSSFGVGYNLGGHSMMTCQMFSSMMQKESIPILTFGYTHGKMNTL